MRLLGGAAGGSSQRHRCPGAEPPRKAGHNKETEAQRDGGPKEDVPNLAVAYEVVFRGRYGRAVVGQLGMQRHRVGVAGRVTQARL